MNNNANFSNNNANQINNKRIGGTNSQTGAKGANQNIINKPNFQIEEIEDDRPAFNQAKDYK
jgi:hypothetical protein